MRKLLLVFILFSLAIISLVSVFKTMTNSSKQVQIAPNMQLPNFDKTAIILSQTVAIPTITDSLTNQNFKAFNQLIKQQFPRIFSSINIEWQSFEKYSLVGKWIGRNSSLAPIVLVASAAVKTPDTKTIIDWSFPPFEGKIDSHFVYGIGTKGGKMSLVAMLAALDQLLQDGQLPNRTVYFVFPQNSQGEAAILNALLQSKQEPEFILKTGGLVAQNVLWKIKNPIAMIGIANASVARIRLEIKGFNPSPVLEQIEQELQNSLPPLDLQNPVLQEFIAYLSPETAFGNRLLFSNEWLFKNIQQNYLTKLPLTQQIFGARYQLETNTNSSKNTIVEIDIYTPKTFANISEWVLNHLQHPQINLLGEPQILQAKNYQSAMDNRAYRVLSNSCKEVFEGALIAPCIAENSPLATTYAAISSKVYYFSPIVYQPNDWQQKQKGLDEKISIQNLNKTTQFYYQLLKNNI